MKRHFRREQFEYYKLDSWEKVKPSVLFLKIVFIYLFVFLSYSSFYDLVVKADKRYNILLSHNLPKKLCAPLRTVYSLIILRIGT